MSKTNIQSKYSAKVCALMLTVLFALSPLALSGCGSSDKAAEVVNSAVNAVSSEKPSAASLEPYIDATNDYNGSMVTFAFAIQPSLERLHTGERQTNISLPNFDNLADSLKRAKEKGSSGFKDVDESTDEVAAILKDLVPLADKMESYYDSKGYLSDDYTKANEYTAQFLPLYEKFQESYHKLDELISMHNKELRLEMLKKLRDKGYKNAAAFTEMNMKLNEVIDMVELDNYDKAAVDKLLQEILTLNESITSDDSWLKSYRSSANNFIGEVRDYMNGNGKWNDLVEEYNRVVDSSNRVELGNLDGQSK